MPISDPHLRRLAEENEDRHAYGNVRNDHRRSHDASSLSSVAVAILAVGFAASAFAADAAAGKVVYDGAKPACKGCHTDVKNPLAKTGAENTVDELKAWVRTPEGHDREEGQEGDHAGLRRRTRSPTPTSRTSWPTWPR